MVDKSTLLDKITDSFKKMVDDLVLYSEYDQELAEGLRWLDEQARYEQLDIYQMVLKVMLRHDAKSRAKDWLRCRN